MLHSLIPALLIVAATAIFLAMLLVAGCAPVQMRSQMDRPTGEAYVSAGDIVLRVQRAEDLPNIYGRADLFGRTRDRGFTEVRYMGLNAAGAPLFRRRDVDIVTNETTMSRTGSFAAFQAQGAGPLARGTHARENSDEATIA